MAWQQFRKHHRARTLNDSESTPCRLISAPKLQEEPDTSKEQLPKATGRSAASVAPPKILIFVSGSAGGGGMLKMELPDHRHGSFGLPLGMEDRKMTSKLAILHWHSNILSSRTTTFCRRDATPSVLRCDQARLSAGCMGAMGYDMTSRFCAQPQIVPACARSTRSKQRAGTS